MDQNNNQFFLNYHAQTCQLNLSGCSMSQRFVEKLKNLPMSQIKKLGLQSLQISPSIMKALFSSPQIKLSKLQHLLLNYNMIGSEGFKYLTEQIRPGLGLKNQNHTNTIPNLKKLELGFCGIGSQGIKNFQQEGGNETPLALQSLNLICNQLSASSAKILSLHARLDNLKQLNLGGNVIGHQGAKYLVKSYWPKLEYLQLSSLWRNQSWDSDHKLKYYLIRKIFILARVKINSFYQRHPGTLQIKLDGDSSLAQIVFFFIPYSIQLNQKVGLSPNSSKLLSKVFLFKLNQFCDYLSQFLPNKYHSFIQVSI